MCAGTEGEKGHIYLNWKLETVSHAGRLDLHSHLLSQSPITDSDDYITTVLGLFFNQGNMIYYWTKAI